MSGHTPGPWRAVPQPGQTQGVHTYTHCVMYGDDSIADLLTECDARLIAAAPDLLAALKKSREQLQYMLDLMKEEGEFYRNADSEVATWLEEIDAAIAKAEGVRDE